MNRRGQRRDRAHLPVDVVLAQAARPVRHPVPMVPGTLRLPVPPAQQRPALVISLTPANGVPGPSGDREDRTDGEEDQPDYPKPVDAQDESNDGQDRS